MTMNASRFQKNCFSQYSVCKTLLTLALSLLSIMPIQALAQENDSSSGTSTMVLRTDELEGELPKGYSAHYFAIEPAEKDGVVTVELVFGPQDDPRTRNTMNLWVLSPEGLRSVVDGERPERVAIAAGNPTGPEPDEEGGSSLGTDDECPDELPDEECPGDPAYKGPATSDVSEAPEPDDFGEFYERDAAFKVVGRQTYTVIVYSRSPVPTEYTLTVGNGTLVDGSAQSVTAQEAIAAQEEAAREAAAQAAAQSTSSSQAGQATNTPQTTTAAEDDEGGDEE